MERPTSSLGQMDSYMETISLLAGLVRSILGLLVFHFDCRQIMLRWPTRVSLLITSHIGELFELKVSNNFFWLGMGANTCD